MTKSPKPVAHRHLLPDPALLLRAIKWANLPGHGHTIAESCAHFGITPGAYRKARKEFGNQPLFGSDDEVILAGLHPGGPVRLDALVYYYDWINHAGISHEQLRVILDRLIAQGLVRKHGDAYALTREWP